MFCSSLREKWNKGIFGQLYFKIQSDCLHGQFHISYERMVHISLVSRTSYLWGLVRVAYIGESLLTLLLASLAYALHSLIELLKQTLWISTEHTTSVICVNLNQIYRIFSKKLETICPRICSKSQFKSAKMSLSVDVRCSKTSLLNLFFKFRLI